MNVINQALASGYTTDQILQYLMRQSPKYAKKISKAMGLGYAPSQILSFLSGKPDDEVGKTEHEMTRNRDEKKRKRNDMLTAAGLATAAGGTAFGLSRAAPAAAQAVQGKMMPPAGPPSPVAPAPPGPQPGSPTIQVGHTPVQVPPNPTPTNPTPGGVPQLPPPPQSPAPQQQQMQQQEPPPQPEALTQEDEAVQQILNRKKEAADLFEKAQKKKPSKEAPDPFMKMARELVKRGDIKDTEGMDEFMKYWRATEGKPRSNPMVEFEKLRASRPKEAALSEEMPSNDVEESQVIPTNALNVRERISQMPQMVKGDMVISPIGLGRIKELRNGKALLEVDGKKHVVEEDALEDSPLSEKDLGDLYDDLISGIEKQTGQQVSRNVEWAGYDPKTNELAYKPHGGKLWVYDDIPEEDAALLTSLLTQRKTTGENFIGAWEEGTTSPIGAAMHQLIMRLQKQRGGKGNEYRNRFDTIYDSIEPARKAAKEKHKKKKKK